jgi:ABC-2 type transport system permease protein
VFPEWLQSLSLAIPTRWAIDGFAAMTWRGLGLEAALTPVGVLLAFSAAMFSLALWRFRWDE